MSISGQAWVQPNVVPPEIPSLHPAICPQETCPITTLTAQEVIAAGADG